MCEKNGQNCDWKGSCQENDYLITVEEYILDKNLADISKDIQKKVVVKIYSASFGLFSVQLDKTMDVKSCFHLIAFIRYVHFRKIKNFVLCSSKGYN